MWVVFIIYMVHNMIFNLIGVLSGIIIARSTVNENLESLGFVKSNAASVLDNSITVV